MKQNLQKNNPLASATGKQPVSAKLVVPVLIAVITLICFSNTFNNQFLFWDDNQFIVNNLHIRRMNWVNIKYLFSNEFGANWQPLTMISYSLNYFFPSTILLAIFLRM
jgi:hypothetical protein